MVPRAGRYTQAKRDDSWELGYADANLVAHPFSYSTGYCEGRAGHAGTDRNQFARRARVELDAQVLHLKR
jgi:hypothetical protein